MNVCNGWKADPRLVAGMGGKRTFYCGRFYRDCLYREASINRPALLRLSSKLGDSLRIKGCLKLRVVIACAVVVGAVWFAVFNSSLFDNRPVQHLLYLGDSYTYYNDMPDMIAEMADLANSPIRYDITTRAYPSATAEDHWKNPKRRELLLHGDWDKVII